MVDRQYDIILTNPQFFTLPKWLPGVRTAEDYVKFHFPSHLDKRRYTIVVESLDTTNKQYRGISKLDYQVELPHVKLPWYGKIGVIPDSTDLPMFEADLIRGSTYIIPDTKGKNGRFKMQRHGVWRP